MPEPSLLDLPPDRRAALERFAAELVPGRRVAVSTHMNADGDACGSEAAFARILAQRGLDAWIVNPTPWPQSFAFLRGDDVVDRTADGAAALAGIDLFVVLDISDVRRLGALADTVRRLRVPRLVLDHHVTPDDPVEGLTVADTRACATGELVFDLAAVLGHPLSEPVARALYAAILTDTGGFRFSNTTPRAHAVAAELLATGVDPEEMYRRIYASMSIGRLHLIRDALGTLQSDESLGLAWISVPADALERYGVRSEDLDGIAEYARSIAGTRLALFFRDLGHGKVKVSFRSTGDVDVSEFARQFGGGGHRKASGAMIAGSMDAVQGKVLEAARGYLAR